jgi:hypothetical protein
MLFLPVFAEDPDGVPDELWDYYEERGVLPGEGGSHVSGGEGRDDPELCTEPQAG